jgi:CubicO group peptidase (beta-lactamase class C family)
MNIKVSQERSILKSFVPWFCGSVILCLLLASSASAQTTYFPPKGEWAKKSPAELGMDPVKLKEAIDFALTRESRREMDFSDQERIFGTLLGSVPNIRAKTNGVIIYKGYVVAEFGDPTWVDPTYSVAKSMLATVTGVAVRNGLISNLNEPVGAKIKDGGYDSPRNAQVTWKHHLQQTSEWEGNMFGKQDNFIGKEAFGEGEMKPREQMKPGTHYEYNDVRINRFALSLLRTFNKSVPDVFREEVMDPIGASNTWRWIPYHNSFVELPGRCEPGVTCAPRKVASVSGGTRWGGGMWINAMDMARFGYLWLRGGKWGDKQIVPAAFVKEALTQGGVANSPGNGYGYLWWLNTTGKALAGMPTNSFSANGAGSNTITVSPDHDLVIVWRWHQGSAGELGRRVIAAIKPGTM